MEKNTHSVEENDTSFPSYNPKEVEALAKQAADDLTKVFAKPYLDELFAARHPKCQQYLEIEKEKLRLLFKMKQYVEVCHDATMSSIAQNPKDDASRNSLINLQKQLLEIQGKIDETVSNINTLSKRFRKRYGFDAFRIKTKRNMVSARIKMRKMGEEGRKTLSLMRRKKKHLALGENKWRVAETADLLTWAYQPGADEEGTKDQWENMAHQIQGDYASLDDSVNAVVRQHILSGVKDEKALRLESMPVVRCAHRNYPLVTAVRVRMAGIIALLGGYTLSEKTTKVGVMLSLLGSEAERLFTQVLGNEAPPFTMEGIAQLSDDQRSEILAAVAARLTAKNAPKDFDIRKIPFMSGIVGNCLDAISTYGIANVAKGLFLRNFREQGRVERMEMARIHALINMALVDEQYDDSEKSLILSLIGALNISERSKEILRQEAENPVMRTVDYALFRGDVLCSDSLLGSLVEVAAADGHIAPSEKLYLQTVGTELGYSDVQLREKFKL